MTPEISVTELAEELKSETPPVLLDVRELDELKICALDNIVHIPMRQIVNRRLELNPESKIVVVCRTGARSAQVTNFLLDNGFSSVFNLAGGMMAWKREIDPSIQSY